MENIKHKHDRWRHRKQYIELIREDPKRFGYLKSL